MTSKPPATARPSLLPDLPAPVWILFAGRLLASLGLGFVLFYSAIFFTGALGLSYTQLGLGLASSAVSGIFARLVGGTLTDRPEWGRRRTLLVALVILSVGYVLFALADNFALFVAANVITGWGFGLYWPANEAVVADLTEGKQRAEAYGLTRSGDSIGLGLGAVAGIAVIALTGNYRLLFWLNACAFLGFFAVVARGVPETRPEHLEAHKFLGGYPEALRDRNLWWYAAANLVFTTIVAQLESTVPVYLRNFAGLSTEAVGACFTLHVALMAAIQLWVARGTSAWRRTRILMLAAVVLAAALVIIWLAGTFSGAAFGLAALALAVAAVALALMHPAAATLVAAMSPHNMRGVYLSINSQCWALGYMIGPAVGGRILDLPRPLSDWLWPGFGLLLLLDCLVLGWLEVRLPPAVNAAGKVQA
ncbi:MAG: MFS transporter [Aphanocapsa lilacina HA4352-LM1]|nr:MFS transporter [Aphanocapsa lilacina HA4352-LM1]